MFREEINAMQSITTKFVLHNNMVIVTLYQFFYIVSGFVFSLLAVFYGGGFTV